MLFRPFYSPLAAAVRNTFRLSNNKNTYINILVLRFALVFFLEIIQVKMFRLWTVFRGIEGQRRTFALRRILQSFRSFIVSSKMRFKALLVVNRMSSYSDIVLLFIIHIANRNHTHSILKYKEN